MDSLTRYRNKCEEIIRELSHEPDQGSLYHYTTFNSLKNILKSRKLRYTHYKNLNDPTEIQFGLELIKESLTKNKFPDYYLQKTKEYFDAYKDECNTYLSSFSEVNTMALWRYYASNGSGVCIVFNDNFYNNNEGNKSISNPVICRVIYGEENCVQIIDKFIDAFKDANPEDLKETPHNLYLELIAHLISILPMLKDKSFEDEKEIRVYFIDGKFISDPATNSPPFYFPSSVKDYIEMPKNDLPFKRVDFDRKLVITPHEFSHKEISQIEIGAACDFAMAQNYVYKLLIDYGYDLNTIKITHSPFPIR